jgi:predicted phage terminase large subunit-like protein
MTVDPRLVAFVRNLTPERRRLYLAEIDRIREKLACGDSLREFLKAAWPIFDPAPFLGNWHLDAIAEHLEAVSYGQIRKLLINVPPRHTKSISVSIAWPSWTWTLKPNPDFPLIGPQVKFMCLSYGDQLAIEHATTMLRLIQSEWYQRNWKDLVRIIKTGTEKFDTSAGGTRISASLQGTTTGRGGDIKILDDVHKVTEAESEIDRRKVIQTYDEALRSRVTDPKISAEVLVMQRVHADDLSGYWLEQGDDCVHLCLPAEYDPARHCVTVLGIDEEGREATWEDPRTREGELLWPDRFGKDELAPYRLNPYSWAGQWQQTPVPRGGGILKAEWWGMWENEKHWPIFDYILASLDGAFTKDKSNDPSALTIWGVYSDEHQRRRIMLVDAWREWLELHDLVTRVAKSCKAFKVDRLLIENKASGKSVAQELERVWANQTWGIDMIDPKSQDKEARVHSIVPLFTDGMEHNPRSYMINAPGAVGSDGLMRWRNFADMVIQEMAMFPRGKWDDLTDSSVQALRYLREMGLAELGWEIQQRRTDALKYRSPKATKPLYVA